MKSYKSWFIAFCLLLCLTSEAFCIDPFKVNDGGFGPKIKGLQLGQKMSLMDLIAWRIQFKGFPFVLLIRTPYGINEVKENYIFIEFMGNGINLESFEIKKATGDFYNFQEREWELGDLLSALEKTGLLEIDTLNCKTLSSEKIIGYDALNPYNDWRIDFLAVVHRNQLCNLKNLL